MDILDNFKGKQNSNGFAKNSQNINYKGPPISIKNQLKEILKANGKLTIKAKDVVRTEKNGDVIIKVCTEMKIALRLTEIAMGKADSTTIKAIQIILDRFDGMPRQTIEFDTQDIKPLVTIRLDPKSIKKEQSN